MVNRDPIETAAGESFGGEPDGRVPEGFGLIRTVLVITAIEIAAIGVFVWWAL